MARKVDLTERLGLGERPRVVIGGVELTVNDSARNLLRVLDMTSGQMGPREVMEACDLMFDEKGRAALESLDLSLADFVKVLEASVELIVGGGDEQGNAGTPATT